MAWNSGTANFWTNLISAPPPNHPPSFPHHYQYLNISISFIQIISLIQQFGIYKVRARLSKFLEYIKWENMSGKGSTRENILNIISNFRCVKHFPFFQSSQKCTCSVCKWHSNKTKWFKRNVFSSFLQNSNFEFVLLIWRWVANLANSCEWRTNVKICISREVINRILFIA